MSNSSTRCLSLLQKCRNMKQLKQAHAQVLTSGLGSNSFALSRVLDFCAEPRHGSLSHALKLFQHIQHPTICICNTMIKAFLLRGEFLNAIVMYSAMRRNGIAPDSYTHPYVLKACARIKKFHLGESVHACAVKLGFVMDVFVGNSLLVMYCAFGNMKDAGQMFDEMPELSAVSWTVMIYGYAKMGDVNTARGLFDRAPIKDRGIWGAMISGYVQNNCFKEGLHMFRLMQLTEVEPDEAIIVTILCACAHMGALDVGIWIHRYLSHLELPLTLRVSTGLMDMYAKCGHLDMTRYLFDEMPQRDTICWNVMISGMAMHGDGEGALKLFKEMEKARIKPDDITFIAILAACSNSGMANEGLKILNKMSTIHKIEPKAEHYGCIIDLLSRAGRFEEAEGVIQRLPNTATASEEAVAWRAFLSACCKHGEMQQAEGAAERLFELERHSGAYVLLSNMYAALGKHGDAKRVRKMMKLKGVEKVPGCSSIKVNGVVTEFIAGDKTHLQIGDIHLVLEVLSKQISQPDRLYF
ncbi:pentatricopeptide repeat-containing protein At2g20540-like [Cucurbita maxima]|uniref:Pentatricopeptide repeat-containing protein At2g20540-like n=1 Tax=Cucurbita maxima TaxID=3661 RepID=A0A6J1I746_CUCMA|nr:pentatricopeptide repeat-containing protein At2g20540-like [Cucurbita maxima]